MNVRLISVVSGERIASIGVHIQARVGSALEWVSNIISYHLPFTGRTTDGATVQTKVYIKQNVLIIE